MKRAHKTIAVVTDHVERLRFNTALAEMMALLNYIAKLAPDELGRFTAESFLLLLAPMAPYVTEEMWHALGHDTSIHLESWPKFDPELTREDSVTVVVQINGKVRDRIQVAPGTDEATVRDLALKSDAVIRNLDGKTPRKFIFVQDRMLSIVV